jgi:hypothetical protein
MKNLSNFLFLSLTTFALSGCNSSDTQAVSGWTATLWLKANAIEGLADTDPVTSWLDSSSNGNNATQDGVLAPPVYVANAINGLPAVSFDRDAPQILNLPDDSLLPTSIDYTDAEFFAVAKLVDLGPSWNSILAMGGGGDNPLFGYDNTNIAWYHEFNTPSNIEGVSLNDSNFHIIQIRQSANAVTIWSDGVAQAPVSFTGTTAPDTALRIIGGDGGSENFGGQLAEVIFNNAIYSEAQRLEIQCYLADKYAITATDCAK